MPLSLSYIIGWWTAPRPDGFHDVRAHLEAPAMLLL